MGTPYPLPIPPREHTSQEWARGKRDLETFVDWTTSRLMKQDLYLFEVSPTPTDSVLFSLKVMRRDQLLGECYFNKEGQAVLFWWGARQELSWEMACEEIWQGLERDMLVQAWKLLGVLQHLRAES